MSVVEDRLAATLAKHAVYVDDCGDASCGCGLELPRRERESHERVHAAHVAAVIASSDDLAVIAKPDAKNPTPALIEAAYIAQDDLSKPPEPWLIEATAEIIDVYIDAQGHDTVHVIGHNAALLAAAKAAEAVSDR